MNRVFTNSLWVALLAFGLTQSAGAQETFTYTGNSFSYVGTSDYYGLPVTSISGYFTLASPIPPKTTVLLTPDTIGGTMTAYSFTDGRYTNNLGNYATTNSMGNGGAYSAPTFAVTTDANGNITSWDLNLLSPSAWIYTWSVSSWSSLVYQSLYDEGAPADGVLADPSQAYDAYNANSPGMWTAQQAVTYTYTGSPFSYVGTSDYFGLPVTSISGYFTLASPIPPNTTVLLTPDTIGGTMTAYSFTDGRYTNNLGNYATTNSMGNGGAYSAPTFAVTTDANGNITSWDLNLLSPSAWIYTWSVSSWSSLVYQSLYDEGAPADGVLADPSQAYDAYNANSPGTWSVTSVASPPLSFTQNGKAVTLTWPASTVGWILQTNAVALTSINSWFTYAVSPNTNAVSFTVNPSQKAVFFRLAKP